MLKITLLFTNKQLAAPCAAGLAEYRKRLSKSCRLEWKNGCTAAEPELKGREKTLLVRLDRAGQALSSPQLAQQFCQWTNQGKSHLVMIFGDLGNPAAAGALDGQEDFCLSLSPLAMSKDVAGLLAAEQIYRSFRIIENQPYHK